MNLTDVHNRRSFLRRATAFGAGAAISTQFVGAGPAAAATNTASPRSAALGLSTAQLTRSTSTPGAAGSTSGYRVTVDTRLNTLERDAGLAPLRKSDAFRTWAVARVHRIERLHGVTPPAQHGKPWRDWVSGRVTEVERFLPRALRFPFYTHMPLATSESQYGPLLRERIRAGTCNGIFLYGAPGTPMAPSVAMDSIVNSGPPVPILMSPKNVSDPVKLAAWMDYWAARPAWIPYVRVAFWQEPQGDFGNAGQPPITTWQEGVTTLADAADRVGIASVAHVETWNLDPSEPFGGVTRLLEMVQPMIHRIGGGITWSVFNFNQDHDQANNFVRWMNEFMATYLPHTLYGVSAYGDSLHPSTPPNSPLRIARAERIASMYTDLNASRARYGGYYAVPDPSNHEWSYLDRYVEAELVDALADLTDPERQGQLLEADALVLSS